MERVRRSEKLNIAKSTLILELRHDVMMCRKQRNTTGCPIYIKMINFNKEKISYPVYWTIITLIDRQDKQDSATSR